MEISNFKQADTADLVVVNPHTKDDTDFVISIAGPSHPATKALRDDSMRRALRRSKAGKDDVTPEDIERDSLDAVTRRVVGWHGLQNGGKDVQFSVDAARSLLGDSSNSWLRAQVNAFMVDESSFMTSSAKG